jgi:hypothetical protein
VLRRAVGSSGAEDPAAKSSLLAFTWPSVRLTLPFDQGVGSSGAEDFVLARLRLDSNWALDKPKCPHSDRRIIRFYCLRFSSSVIHPAHLGIGLSVHSTVSSSFYLLCSVPTTLTLCTDGAAGSSDGVFFLLFLRVFNLDLCFNLTYLTCHYL